MNNLLNKIGTGMALALLLCLFPMPYGYYTLIRFTAMIIFGCMAFNFYKNKQIVFCLIAGFLSLLFQPFFKMAFGRAIWNLIDVIVAILLFLLWYKNKND